MKKYPYVFNKPHNCREGNLANSELLFEPREIDPPIPNQYPTTMLDETLRSGLLFLLLLKDDQNSEKLHKKS